MPGVVSDRLREALCAALRESGKTHDFIAEKIGVDRSRVSRFVAGENGLRMSALDALAKLLELELVPRSEASTARDVPRQGHKTAHK